MAEEWGLLGGLLVLLVFGIVLRWGWTVARRAPDRFSSLLAGGMTATIFFYVAINLLMVMGLAPGGRHPAAVHEPRRLVDDDQHDLHRHADDGRSLEPQAGGRRPFA
jgi:hypothetical protein